MFKRARKPKVCGHALTGIFWNGRHPTCDVTAGHDGRHIDHVARMSWEHPETPGMMTVSSF
jgi:hypothetical protein